MDPLAVEELELDWSDDEFLRDSSEQGDDEDDGDEDDDDLDEDSFTICDEWETETEDAQPTSSDGNERPHALGGFPNAVGRSLSSEWKPLSKIECPPRRPKSKLEKRVLELEENIKVARAKLMIEGVLSNVSDMEGKLRKTPSPIKCDISAGKKRKLEKDKSTNLSSQNNHSKRLTPSTALPPPVPVLPRRKLVKCIEKDPTPSGSWTGTPQHQNLAWPAVTRAADDYYYLHQDPNYPYSGPPNYCTYLDSPMMTPGAQNYHHESYYSHHESYYSHHDMSMPLRHPPNCNWNINPYQPLNVSADSNCS